MTPETIDNFFSFLYTGGIGNITFWLELLAGVVSSALIAAIVVILLKYWQLLGIGPRRPTSAPADIPDISVSEPWQKILQKLDSPNPSDWNIAVIQADSIFDGILKAMGLAGETMGERLKEFDSSELESINDVWEAHKTRNRIAHETERALTHDEARRAVRLFEKALRELGYLQ